MHPKGLSGGRYELAQGLARARQEGVPGLRGGGHMAATSHRVSGAGGASPKLGTR